MGMSCLVVCATCPAAGPPIGDFGYLGRPSMEKAFKDDVDTPFGFFYQTFHDIGISTDELEAMAAFLRQHDGHTLTLSVDGTFAPEIPNAQEVNEFLNENDDSEPLGYKDFADRAHRDFIVGHYVVRCRCGKAFNSEPTILRSMPEVRWTSELLERFRLLFNYAEENTYHLTEPLIDPSDETAAPLIQIEQFVADHLDHGVVSCVVPHGTVTPTAAGALPSAAPSRPSQPNARPPQVAPSPTRSARRDAWPVWLLGIAAVGMIISTLMTYGERGEVVPWKVGVAVALLWRTWEQWKQWPP